VKDTTLYYALSTIAMVAAALIGFSGCGGWIGYRNKL
jgi:hypothetical protein